jgi:DNA invertase Pin-like site-specific DNA recombinase
MDGAAEAYEKPATRAVEQTQGADNKELFLCISYRHKSGMKYGYARVSTDGQSVDAQVRQLTKAGCKKVFREVASGDKTDRAQLRRLLDQLEAGDVVTVTRLDRLARSTRDLLNTLAAIASRKAGFQSLGDAWADTTTSRGRLMLTVLGGLAEFERDLIRTRTGEGRARAVARGQRMGRPPKLTPHQQKEAIKRRDRGEESLTEIGRSYNVSASTISRLRA